MGGLQNGAEHEGQRGMWGQVVDAGEYQFNSTDQAGLMWMGV